MRKTVEWIEVEVRSEEGLVSGKVASGEEEEGKEGEGERKAECGGGKKAMRVIEESFSGMSTPSSTVTVSKKRESTR